MNLRNNFFVMSSLSIGSLVIGIVVYLLLKGNFTLRGFIDTYFMVGITLVVVGAILFLHSVKMWVNLTRATKRLIYAFIPMEKFRSSESKDGYPLGFWSKIIIVNGIASVIITSIIAIIWF